MGDERLDAVTFLTACLVLLFAIESGLVVGPLGGIGQPATLLALAGLGWWAFFHIQRPAPVVVSRQPVRAMLFVTVACFAMSYVAAMSRPIDGTETSLANIGLVMLLAWSGPALLANDGIPTRRRFDVLVGRVVIAGAALAALGIAQFATKSTLVDGLAIPGLTHNLPAGQLLNRSGFARPSGTALHPIEFGAVLTMILPLAVTRARRSTSQVARSWTPTALIGLAIVLSSSRSALLCGLVGLLVLGAGWSPRARVEAAVAVLVLFAAVAFTVPRMLGSLLHLFSRIDGDTSIGSRTDSYPLVGQMVHAAPLFGRGFRTLTPDYRILDNQYLGLSVEVGVVGLISILALLTTACGAAYLARRRSLVREERELGQALFAAVAAGAVGLGMYDGFAFPMASAVLFLLVGMAGGHWRLVRERAIEVLEVAQTSPRTHL